MSMIGRILTRLFALFGMTLTCVACYGVPEVEYNPTFAATGRVVNPEGKPIEGIRADIGGNTTTSDADGWFYVSGTTPSLELVDIDGLEGGGEFLPRVINVATHGGVAELGDVKLERVSEEAE